MKRAFMVLNGGIAFDVLMIAIVHMRHRLRMLMLMRLCSMRIQPTGKGERQCGQTRQYSECANHQREDNGRLLTKLWRQE